MNNQSDNQRHSQRGACRAVSEVNAAEAQPSDLMDRASAFAVLGLAETANAYAVDNRFWQLTKRFRMEKNDAKLKEVTEAYEVASGRAAVKEAEKIVEDKSKKVFGKSVRQWKVYFYYTWWKIFLVLLCVVLTGAFLMQVFFGKDYDIKIVSIGHFAMDNTILDKYLTEEFEYTNPYLTYADVIVDASEEQSNATVYGPASAMTFLSLDPEVIIFDAKTLPYYTPYVMNLNSYYQSLQETLPEGILNKITPVTCSMEQFYKLTDEEGDETPVTGEDEIEYICGIKISDPELIYALGYVNEWSTAKDSLVFTIGSACEDPSKAEEFITAVLLNQDEFIEEYIAAKVTIDETP